MGYAPEAVQGTQNINEGDTIINLVIISNSRDIFLN